MVTAPLQRHLGPTRQCPSLQQHMVATDLHQELFAASRGAALDCCQHCFQVQMLTSAAAQPHRYYEDLLSADRDWLCPLQFNLKCPVLVSTCVAPSCVARSALCALRTPVCSCLQPAWTGLNLLELPALQRTAQPSTVQHGIAQRYIVQHSIAHTLHCIAQYCRAKHCIALHSPALPCTALLRCTALRCVAHRCVAHRCVA